MNMSQSQSQSTPPNTPGWFKDYAAERGKYDELIDSEGNIRAHWKPIAAKFDQISSTSWNKRKAQLDKIIYEYGVTYNLYGVDGSEKNAWSMDMMPQCLPESEIHKIESMLGQRAFLLNLILQDVYGRQGLLKGGKIDPYLVYANPHYLRPCHGLLNARQRHIHVYAADLVRMPDGSWNVMADRVESAGGMGYALENRALMSRIFPAVMAESGVRSLQPFTKDFSNYIESLAPSYVDSPNIALLSSGSFHETYFEQSFLSRNLGFNLVEGPDLMVRNSHLYMKTVKGVKPIDVLLRRVNSDWCDPLELKNSSLLGVPGLVNVIRKGNLAVANALGSGFAETTALPAMLPWFARNYLGENLEMPSSKTWWCGIPDDFKYVVENIDKLVIKSTFRRSNSKSYFGPRLTKNEKEQLLKMIYHEPLAFCALDAVIHGTVPVVRGSQLENSQFVMRVMMIPSDTGWKIMPGGLVKYSENGESEISVSMQKGAGSKDVWILGDPTKKPEGSNEKPQSEVTSNLFINRGSYYQEDLPSRAADNLFWLGRYLERSEGLARLLKTVSSMLISQSGNYSLNSARPLVDELPKLPEQSFSLAVDIEPVSLEKTEEMMLNALYNKSCGESLACNFGNVERSASNVKERLSADSWHKLLSVCQMGKKDQTTRLSVYDDDVILSLDAMLDDLSGFIGNLMENMTRSYGWYYLQIGRRIERAFAICRLMKSTFTTGQIDSDSTLEHLLIWGDSSITYRRSYVNRMIAENVLDVLCFDETNPRSLAYQAEDIKNLFSKLPHHQSQRKHPLDLSSLSLYSRISLCKSAELTEAFRSGNIEIVNQFFDLNMADLTNLAHELEQTYFAHTQIQMTESLIDSF